MGKKVLVCLLAVVSLSFTASSVFAVPRSSAPVSISPSSLAFGSVTVNTNSAAQTIVISNESSHSREILSVNSGLSEFVVTGPAAPFTLAGHATASFSVVFVPNAASSYSGSVAVTVKYWDGNETTISVPVSGTGKSAAPPPTYLLSSSVSSLSFANTLVGSSASQSVTLTNTGTGAVTVSSATISGSGFAVSGLSGSVSLAAGNSLSLSVSFAPTAVGSVSGSLTVVSTASNSPATVALSGAGVQPAISVTPSSVSFSNVSVGVTNTQAITIKNTGTANLTVSASLPGSTFTMSGLTTPLTLAAGASSSFSVNFTPASASTFYANLSLTNNSPTSPVVVALSGSSVAPVLTLSASPTSLNFGSVTTNSSTSQTVTVTNTGNASVSISGIAASGTGFSTSGVSLPITLAAGQSTSFSVVFDPTSAGSLTGSVAVTSNASNSPLSVALSGTGTAPTTYSVSLTWTPASSASGFNLYRGTQSGGPYTKLNSSGLSTASYTDSSVTAGQTYYYVATDLNSSGQESTYSNQVTAAIP